MFDSKEYAELQIRLAVVSGRCNAWSKIIAEKTDIALYEEGRNLRASKLFAECEQAFDDAREYLTKCEKFFYAGDKQ